MTESWTWARGGRMLWLLVAAQAALTVALALATGVRFDPALVARIGLPIALCAGVGLFYLRVRPDPRLAIAGQALAICLLILALGQGMTYAVATTPAPLADAWLAGWERALGFDWIGYVGFIDRHAWLADLLGYAYASFNIQPVLIAGLLAFRRQDRLLIRFLLAMMGTLMVTIAVFAVMPAVSAYAHYGIAPDRFHALHPINNTQHVAILMGLRDGSLRFIGGDVLYGLVTFPSFHTCAGILFGWALWTQRDLRVPGALLNALLVAATPAHGAHYLPDILAGTALAAAGIWATGVLTRKEARGTPAPLIFA